MSFVQLVLCSAIAFALAFCKPRFAAVAGNGLGTDRHGRQVVVQSSPALCGGMSNALLSIASSVFGC